MATVYDFDRTLTRGSEYKINNTPIVNGKMRLAKDTARLFFDIEDEQRIEITDFIKDYTEDQILNVISYPRPKFYVAKDTNRIFRYNFEEEVWQTISDKVSEAEYATRSSYAENDELGNNIRQTYAPLDSPELYGTPITPYPSTTQQDQIVNVRFVLDYVFESLQNLTSGIIVFCNSFEELPEIGENGKIYFIPSTREGESDIFDEYIWSDITGQYERFGRTDLNLRGYFHSLSSDGSGNAITSVEYDENNDILKFHKDSTFLTKHPDVETSSTSSLIEPEYGTTFTVIDSINRDDNGHATSFNTKTVKIPSNTGTAEYAYKDESGNNIKSSYGSTIDISGDNLVIKNKNDEILASVTIPFATKSKNDESGNEIKVTYGSSLTKNNTTISLVNKNGEVISNLVVPYSEKATNADTATYSVSAGSVAWNNVSGKPDTFAPSTHSHATTDINNFNSSVAAIKVNNASNADYATTAGSANAVDWSNVSNKPTSISHADSASSVDWSQIANRPTNIHEGGSIDHADNATNASSANYATNSGNATNASTSAFSKIAGNPDIVNDERENSILDDTLWDYGCIDEE